jgi:aminoglycoside 6'-N-acetyltransferase I
MHIAPASIADLDRIAPLRSALWPDSDIAELADDPATWTGPQAPGILLIAATDDRAIGFAEARLRTDYVNGCDGSPVAFLEGIYVDPAHRGTGIGRALVEAVRLWGEERGAPEFASDALLDNVESHTFHRAVGFQETERVVYFRMARP